MRTLSFLSLFFAVACGSSDKSNDTYDGMCLSICSNTEVYNFTVSMEEYQATMIIENESGTDIVEINYTGEWTELYGENTAVIVQIEDSKITLISEWGRPFTDVEFLINDAVIEPFDVENSISEECGTTCDVNNYFVDTEAL